MVNIKNYVTFENGQRMPLVGLGTWQVRMFQFDFENPQLILSFKKIRRLMKKSRKL